MTAAPFLLLYDYLLKLGKFLFFRFVFLQYLLLISIIVYNTDNHAHAASSLGTRLHKGGLSFATMKTIGLIGGMTWYSSLEYYRIINKHVQEIMRGGHSAKIVMISHNFAEIETLLRTNNRQDATALLADSAQKLEKAGADAVVLCTSTLHSVAEETAAACSIPLIHIGDCLGKKIAETPCKKIGLLGTSFTMEQDFLTGILKDEYELEVVVPSRGDRENIQRIIQHELINGRFYAESRRYLKQVMQAMADTGVQGIILSCTELPLLIQPEDTPLPLFNATSIHAHAAARFALIH